MWQTSFGCQLSTVMLHRPFACLHGYHMTSLWSFIQSRYHVKGGDDWLIFYRQVSILILELCLKIVGIFVYYSSLAFGPQCATTLQAPRYIEL